MHGARFVQQLRAGLRQGWRAHAAGAQRNVAAAAGAAGALGQLVQRAGLKLAGGAMVLGGGGTAVTMMTREQQVEIEASSETAKLAWVQALAAQPGMREVLVPGQQLRKHPVGQLISEEDHLVGATGVFSS
ncbi:hypothetical protein MNEG_11233 [Monoraphidium neglectum]|uniref:Uncharacterized protein n=1 Tax=Monoraphidium neglectum TaxID=145388 RepID=A0A0D2M688_9CHLO|nr:hypothetical protein MNEG_11233 [Monoraphidium neglectum]KIY96726.1 hypothetical protein MNEG_11233 [Monoraphidium neglectum]|eukprot:XP_013895746.1 hypothetical protein MNEG_11233 [Monoraphidium neglectum]